MTGCEALAAAALFACLARDPECLPVEHRHLEGDLKAIGEQESGLRPWSVRDEATKEGRFFATYADAVRFATERDALGHRLGLGWFQITGRSNWKAHGLDIATALLACPNMRAGAEHFAANVKDAARQLYNSGRIDGAPRYAAEVAARMMRGASYTTQVLPVAVTPTPRAPTTKPLDPIADVAPVPHSWHAAVTATMQGALP